MVPRHYLLSPHSDDIAYSMSGSIISGRIPRGAVLVSVFTKGCFTVGEDRFDPSQVATTTEVRRREDRAFCRRLGLNYAELGLSDATLRGYRNVDSVFSAGRIFSDAYLDTVRQELARFVGSLRWAFVLWCPLGLGRHIDHLLLRRAVESGLSRQGAVHFYEDLPYAADYDDEVVVKIGLQAGADPCVVNCAVHESSKLEALRLYRSQVLDDDIEKVRSHGRRICDGGFAERLWLSR